MFRRPSSLLRWFSFALLFAALSAAASLHAQDSSKRGRKYKAPAATARVEVTVLRATTGKPVENAAVIFHPLSNGKDDGNMELKTNDEGKAIIDLLEIGSDVRLQVIAPGYQTYGEDYKVDKDNLAIEIKLKRPAEQYSVYKKSEGRVAPAAPADKPKPDASADPKDAAPKDASPQDPAAPAKPDAAPPASSTQPK